MVRVLSGHSLEVECRSFQFLKVPMVYPMQGWKRSSSHDVVPWFEHVLYILPFILRSHRVPRLSPSVFLFCGYRLLPTFLHLLDHH